MITVAVIVIYPLLTTVASAFKAGNMIAFKLDLSTTWTLEKFCRLFKKTLYLTWYKNTLFVAICTMLIQVTVIVLSGFAYSHYRFVGRKQSLMLF